MTCPICGNSEKSNICSFCGYDRSCDCELYPLLSRTGKAASAKSAFRFKFYSGIVKKSDGLETRVAELERSMKSVLERLARGTSAEIPAAALQNTVTAEPEISGEPVENTDPQPAVENVPEESEASDADTAEKPAGIFGSVKPGDTVSFGSYKGNPLEWLALSSDEKGVLLLSKHIIDHAPYNDLCQWLDGSFLSEAFGENERALIAPCKIDINGFTVPADSGESNETFKAFPLSERDYIRHRNVTGVQPALRTEYDIRKCTQIKYANPNTWWLRPVGFMPTYAPLTCVDKNGYVSNVNHLSGYLRGVRPAILVTAD